MGTVLSFSAGCGEFSAYQASVSPQPCIGIVNWSFLAPDSVLLSTADIRLKCPLGRLHSTTVYGPTWPWRKPMDGTVTATCQPAVRTVWAWTVVWDRSRLKFHLLRSYGRAGKGEGLSHTAHGCGQRTVLVGNVASRVFPSHK